MDANHEEPQGGRVDRRHLAQAAHLRDRPVVGPLVDHADQQEEGAGDEAVVDHLEDRALEALRRWKLKIPSVTKPMWLTEL